MATTPTDNMNLELPNPANATDPEAGPLWATDLNVALIAVDAHDHTTGHGVPVASAGLRINADLPFTYGGTHYGPISAAYFGFFPQTAPTAGQHTASLYVDASGALFYRSAGGTDIQISSNTMLSDTGTGAFNGFYGDYSGGSAAYAVAYYRTANSSFELYSPLGGGLSTPTDYTQLTSLLTKTFVSRNGGVASLAFISLDPAATTFGGAYKGGWALTNPNAVGKGLAVAMDSTTGLVGGADGTYSNAVLGVYNATAYGLPGKWGFSVNRPETDGTFKGRAANPLDLWLYGTATATPQVISTLSALTSGTPAAGYGNRQAFLAGGTAWSGYGNALPTVYTQGAVDSFFQSATVANGSGLRLRGAYANTLSTTAGIEIAALSAGLDSIGLGGAATNNGLVTVYGHMVPEANNTRDLGSSSFRYRSLYVNDIEAAATLTVLATGIALVANTTVTGTLGVSGTSALAAVTASTVTASSTVQGTIVYPTSSAASMTAAKGGSFLHNQVLGWGVTNGSGSLTVGWNVAVARRGGEPAGVYDVTFTTAPAGATYAVVALLSGNYTADNTIFVWNQTASGFTFNTVSAGVLADNDLHFIVVGSP